MRQNDPLAPSLIVMWVIGHEVGHVVLRHRHSGGSPNAVASSIDPLRRYHLNEIASVAELSSPDEVAADKLATIMPAGWTTTAVADSGRSVVLTSEKGTRS